MDISATDRRLRRLITSDDDSLLPPDLRKKVRRIVTMLRAANGMAEFRAKAPRGWRVHQLKGDRDGEWSIWASGDQRITFYESDGRIEHMDMENYH